MYPFFPCFPLASEAYLQRSRISAMELFAKINYFRKKISIVDVWLGSKCDSGWLTKLLQKKNVSRSRVAVEKSLFKTNIEQKKQLMSYFSKTEFRISHNKLNKNEKKKKTVARYLQTFSIVLQICIMRIKMLLIYFFRFFCYLSCLIPEKLFWEKWKSTKRENFGIDFT